MESLARLLMVFGGALLLLDALLYLATRLGFKALPGDLRYQSDHLSFYFPLATCLILSLLLTLALWLWQWFTHR